MNQTIDPFLKVRVANFSNVELSNEHLLNFDSEDTATMVSRIRRYADLPYVYVVEKDRAARVAELLSALKAIRSPCFPYALVSLDGAEVDVNDTDLDVIRVDSTDAKTIQASIDEYAFRRLVFDENGLRINNSNPLPEKVDVAIIGAEGETVFEGVEGVDGQ